MITEKSLLAPIGRKSKRALPFVKTIFSRVSLIGDNATDLINVSHDAIDDCLGICKQRGERNHAV